MAPRALILSALLAGMPTAEPAWANPQPPVAPADSVVGMAHLVNQLRALEREYEVVSRDPERYYLVIDLPAGNVDLKSGARLLRRSRVRSVTVGRPQSDTSLHRYRQNVPPVTPEPGTRSLRLGGQRVPLDFWGRLTEGPRQRSRLCFDGGLILQPDGPACSDTGFCVVLNGSDIKSLGSGLSRGAPAILIPPTSPPSGEAE